MSFHPFLPPICDPKDNHLLVDGYFINNLPGFAFHCSSDTSFGTSIKMYTNATNNVPP